MFQNVNDTFATRQLVTVIDDLSGLEGKARKSVKYRARESTTYCLISSPSWTLISFWRRQKCPNIRRCGCRAAGGRGAWSSGLGLRVARPPPSLCRRTAHSRRLRHCYITRVVLGLPKRSCPRSLDKSGYTARQNKQRRLISQRLKGSRLIGDDTIDLSYT